MWTLHQVDPCSKGQYNQEQWLPKSFEQNSQQEIFFILHSVYTYVHIHTIVTKHYFPILQALYCIFHSILLYFIYSKQC